LGINGQEVGKFPAIGALASFPVIVTDAPRPLSQTQVAVTMGRS